MSRVYKALQRIQSLEFNAAPLTKPIRPSEQAETNTQAVTATVECKVVATKPAQGTPLYPFAETHSELIKDRLAEQYRVIRLNLLNAKRRVITISSASPGDGKTVNATNIAIFLSMKKDLRVLLVDADLRRAGLGRAFRLQDNEGLAEVLRGERSTSETIVQPEQFPGLYILPAGLRLENPIDLLDSVKWQALVDELRTQFDYIVLDTTPVTVVADYSLVSSVSDGVVLVARENHTDRVLMRNAIGSVSKEKLIGVVVNCATDWFLWKTTEYYGSVYSLGGKRKS